MEVHPPEHAIHNWRDFFVHIGTITIGLLIALFLEGLVEAAHHQHLLHTAEANLQTELKDNKALLQSDENFLTVTQQDLQKSLATLQAAKAHQPAGDLPHNGWEWDSPQSAAWDTARDNGALALMTYDQAQGFAVVYEQQKVVNDQAVRFIRDIYAISAPLQGKTRLADLPPATLDTMIGNTEQTLADLNLLHDYAESLGRVYSHAHANER